MIHNFSTVQKGSTGTDVYILQSFLHSMMYLGKDGKVIDIDGEAGSNTEYAINTFKSLNKTYGSYCGEPDGKFTLECWKRLGLIPLEQEEKNIELNKMYQWCVETCNNPKVGYSQDYRNQRTVNGITYYDCSSFVYYALYYGGFPVDVNAWPFTTYTMQSILKSLGFKEYNAKDVKWKRSDILWSQEHTEVVYAGTQQTGQGYTMGAHGKTNRTLENQVSINDFLSTYSKYPKLYRYEV